MAKILYVSRPFENSVEGTGDQAVAREIVTAIKSKYPDIQIDYPKRVLIPEYHNPLSIVAYDYIAPLLFAIKSLFAPYDLVIFNSAYQAGCIRLFFSKRTRKVSIIFGFLFLHNKNKSLFDMYSYKLYDLAMGSSNSIIAATGENQEIIRERYQKDAKLIPLGASQHLSSDEVVATKKAGTVLGYIGAYNRRKRTDYWLDLIASPSAKGLKAILAGRMGDEFKSKLDAILQKAKAAVEVLGEISESDKANFYSKINFLYFPTAWEGFGLPIAEAMACGAIPLVHNDAEIPAVLKKKCVLVSGPDEAIDRVNDFGHDAETYKATILSNRKYAQKHFNWENYADFFAAECTDASPGLGVLEVE